MKKVFAFFAIFMIIAVSGCIGDGITGEKGLCKSAGGEWKEFSNTCVDSCEYRRAEESMMCGMAMTYGCECGEDKCWNGESCELIVEEIVNEVVEEPEAEVETQLDVIYIDILRSEYDPAEVTVQLGQTIVWTNQDDRTHAVGGAQFGGDSGTLQPGETWNYTINRVQLYRFYDTFYFFQGRIFVE